MDAKTTAKPVDLAPNPRRALRLDRVLDRLGVSKSTLYQMVADGTFPAPLKVGTANGAAVWLEGWCDDYIATRIEQRDSKSAKAA